MTPRWRSRRILTSGAPAAASVLRLYVARFSGSACVEKRKTLHAAERERPDVQTERSAFRSEVSALHPDRLVFVDESGVLTNMVRLYARAPKGQRAYGSAPAGRWQRLTVLGALAREGAAMTIAAATDTAVFLAFLDHVLIPELPRTKPDAVVIIDNLSPHKAPAVRARLEAAGLTLLYLPRYSPDLSPIELLWAKLKTYLRAVAARTAEALDTALADALNRITPTDARGFFRHGGYILSAN